MNCRSKASKSDDNWRSVPWVIFDADNTLWHTEPLYDSARREFVEYLETFGVDSQRADQEQRERDVLLFDRFGYAPKRFEESFVRTVEHLIPDCAPKIERHVRTIAQSVFTGDPQIDADAGMVLERLGRSYRLALLTAGVQSVQERRLEMFPYTKRFDALQIVQRKTQEVFDNFCRTYNVARKRSYVVGDSLRSDVIPAIHAGLKAIWRQTPNWQEFESISIELPPDVERIERLAELLEIIQLESA